MPFKISYLLIPLFFVLTVPFTSCTNSCANYVAYETPPLSMTCTNVGARPTSNLGIATTSRQLVISMTVKLATYCSNDVEIFVVRVNSPNDGGTKRVLRFYYEMNTDLFKLDTETYSTTINGFQFQLANMYGTVLTIYAAVNLDPVSPRFDGTVVVDNTYQTFQKTPSYIYSNWFFDSNAVYSLCADLDGTRSVACEVQNFKILSNLPNHPHEALLGNQVTMIGDYKLDDAPTGLTLSNSVVTNGLSSISLGATNNPTWESSGQKILQFTSTSSFLEIPGFALQGHDANIIASVAFAFYIKIKQAPAASTKAKILSYKCDAFSNLEIYRLEIDSNLQLITYIETTAAMTPPAFSPLTLGGWHMIYVSFLNMRKGQAFAKIIVDGVSNEASNRHERYTKLHSSCTASSTVTVGNGFIGELKRIQVYSPAASQPSSTPWDSSSCALNLGYTDPVTCLQTVCAPKTYVSFNSCENCPTQCKTCLDPQTCASCDDGEYLQSGECKICPIKCKTCSDSGTCESCHAGKYLQSGECETCPTECKTCTSLTNCQLCQAGYGLVNNLCGTCPADTTLNGQTCEPNTLSDDLKEAIEKTQLLNSAATQAANLLSKGKAISLSAAIAGKIFSMIKYLDVGYSDELQVALKTWLSSFISLGLTPDLPNSTVDSFENVESRPVPEVFAKYEVSSSFLVNFWENLGIVAFAGSIWLLLKGLELCLQDKKSKAYSYTQTCQVHVQNFLFSALYGVYGDLILFAILEYRTYDSGISVAIISIIISIILLFVMIAHITFHIRLLIQYQKIKKSDSTAALEEFIETNKKSKVLFDDFKDNDLATQMFFVFLTARDMLISLVLATMFEYPLVQVTIILILTLLMLAFFMLKKPFKNGIDTVQQYFFEIVGVIVNITVFGNGIMDAGEYEVTQARINIGKTIIIINMIFNFITGVFMLIMIVQTLREAYHSYKAKKASRSSSKKKIHIEKKNKTSQEMVSTRQNNNNSELNIFGQNNTSDLNISSLEDQISENDKKSLFPQNIQTSHPKRIEIKPSSYKSRFLSAENISLEQTNIQNRTNLNTINQRQMITLNQNQHRNPRIRRRPNLDAGTINL